MISTTLNDTKKAVVLDKAGFKVSIDSTGIKKNQFTQTVIKTKTAQARASLLDLNNSLNTNVIPEDFFTVGTSIKIEALGVLTTTTGAGENAFIVKLNDGVSDLDLVSTPAFSGAYDLPDGQTNLLWRLEIFLTCRSEGASGTVAADGWFQYINALGELKAVPMLGSDISLDTTQSYTIDLDQQWQNAGNSISVKHLKIQS